MEPVRPAFMGNRSVDSNFILYHPCTCPENEVSQECGETEQTSRTRVPSINANYTARASLSADLKVAIKNVTEK